jgi:hypothetical protein
MNAGQKWLQHRSWTDQFSWKVSLTIVSALAGAVVALKLFGIW